MNDPPRDFRGFAQTVGDAKGDRKGVRDETPVFAA
jgi:hypothetical protein